MTSLFLFLFFLAVKYNFYTFWRTQSEHGVEASTQFPWALRPFGIIIKSRYECISYKCVTWSGTSGEGNLPALCVQSVTPFFPRRYAWTPQRDKPRHGWQASTKTVGVTVRSFNDLTWLPPLDVIASDSYNGRQHW